MIRQRLADFETFRQVTEQGGAFFGQHAGPPTSHAGQDGIASVLALELRCLQRSKLPEGMPGKHGPHGAVTCPGAALAKTGGWRVTFQ